MMTFFSFALLEFGSVDRVAWRTPPLTMGVLGVCIRQTLVISSTAVMMDMWVPGDLIRY